MEVLVCRMFAGALALLSGVLVSYLMEILMHRVSDVEFELPKESDQPVHGVLKRRLSIRSDVEEQVEGQVIQNPVFKETKDLEMQELPTAEANHVLSGHGVEIHNITGSTRDLAKEEYFVDEKVLSNLRSVGLLSAIAITIHNFPEGVVSYIAYLDNPKLGVSLAIGIAAHNIPEGLSVALPVFYATNKRHMAFLWALLAGLAEPVGALICYLFIGQSVSPSLFGFLFGFTAGVMTYICVYELLPTGVTLDCEKNYTCLSFMIGVFFILGTLCLVSYV